MTAGTYEAEARQRKARLLADALKADGLTDADAAALSTQARADYALIAGFRTPSAATWDLAISMLAPTPVTPADDDPFDGIAA